MLKIVRAILQQVIDDIDSGNCNATQEELMQLYETAMLYKQSTNYLTKEESARYIGVSRATFDRMVDDGILPPGTKRSGIRNLMWTQLQLEPHRKK